jgi:hypothetical protein
MRWMRLVLIMALPGLVVLLNGCMQCGDRCCRLCGLKERWHAARAARPQAPYPAPFGAHVRSFITAQTAKADGADFTIFLDEWYLGGAKLGPFGQRHLLALAPVLGQVPTPVLIQCGLDPELDQQRRMYVVEQLSIKGIADADQRVVLGFPEAEGLDGEFSERIYLSMIYRSTGGILGRNGFRSGIFSNIGAFGGLGAFGGGIGMGGIGGFGGLGYPGY